jgi:hypothetical protein
MREIRPSGSEGGVVRKRHPYPYQQDRSPALRLRACLDGHRLVRTPCRLKVCDTVPQTRADAGRYAFGQADGIADLALRGRRLAFPAGLS